MRVNATQSYTDVDGLMMRLGIGAGQCEQGVLFPRRPRLGHRHSLFAGIPVHVARRTQVPEKSVGRAR